MSAHAMPLGYPLYLVWYIVSDDGPILYTYDLVIAYRDAPAQYLTVDGRWVDTFPMLASFTGPKAAADAYEYAKELRAS
jgi:hypothetical protein